MAVEIETVHTHLSAWIRSSVVTMYAGSEVERIRCFQIAYPRSQDLWLTAASQQHNSDSPGTTGQTRESE